MVPSRLIENPSTSGMRENRSEFHSGDSERIAVKRLTIGTINTNFACKTVEQGTDIILIQTIDNQNHAAAPVSLIRPGCKAMRRGKHALHPMNDERPVRIVTQGENRFHAQKLRTVGRAQEINEHLQRHRCNQTIMKQ